MCGVGVVFESSNSVFSSQNALYAVMLLFEGGIGLGMYFVLAYVFRLRPMAEYCNILLPIIRKYAPKLSDRIASVSWER